MIARDKRDKRVRKPLEQERKSKKVGVRVEVGTFSEGPSSNQRSRVAHDTEAVAHAFDRTSTGETPPVKYRLVINSANSAMERKTV